MTKPLYEPEIEGILKAVAEKTKTLSCNHDKHTLQLEFPQYFIGCADDKYMVLPINHYKAYVRAEEYGHQVFSFREHAQIALNAIFTYDALKSGQMVMLNINDEEDEAPEARYKDPYEVFVKEIAQKAADDFKERTEEVSGWWEATCGNHYHYVQGCGEVTKGFCGILQCNGSVDNFNCFESEEKANKSSERKETTWHNFLKKCSIEMDGNWQPDWKDFSTPKCYIVFNEVNNKFDWHSARNDKKLGVVYFSTREKCKSAIKKANELIEEGRLVL